MGKNRSIEQKKLKMKRRNRHAVFSGATTRFVSERNVEVLVHEGEDKATLKVIRVPVGAVSLSKAVMNTGRGPDAMRMQEYYQRIHSYDEALPDTIGAVPIDQLKTSRRTDGGLRLKDFDLAKQYAEFIVGVPKEMHICLLQDDLAKLDLFFNMNQWFFVEIDYKKKRIRRSTIYKNRDMAMAVFRADIITWVEQLPKTNPAATR